jgi:O-antigen/teichoic acid export membrane protein
LPESLTAAPETVSERGDEPAAFPPHHTAVSPVIKAPESHSELSDDAAHGIGRRTANGALITLAAQAAAFVLRTGSMVVLARLILPRDFGLVAMVTAFTGFLGLLRDGGLPMAAVQRPTITHDQMSTLFWINVAIGGCLALLCGLAAPMLVRFYGEPRLFWISPVLGLAFVFNGASIQHRALLQRALRFRLLAAIDLGSLALSTGLAIGAAVAGAGYWAIVVMTVVLPAVGAVGAWVTTQWVPGPPRRGSGVRSMLWFGGTVTLNTIFVYVAYNTDKVLLGRVWGAEALGIYGRAYQLINIPLDNLNASLGLVAFPALARLQDNRARMREYFLKGYSSFHCVILPLIAVSLLFADDIVRVLLGPRWSAAVIIFRLLAPTVLAFALINPLGWLLLASGHALRSLKIALFLVPVVITGYSLGLAYGAQGVALGFSVAMMLLLLPVVRWTTHGTVITLRDLVNVLVHPFLAIVMASAGSLMLRAWTMRLEPALLRLVIETGILLSLYAIILLWVFGKRSEYASILQKAGFWPPRRDS